MLCGLPAPLFDALGSVPLPDHRTCLANGILDHPAPGEISILNFFKIDFDAEQLSA